MSSTIFMVGADNTLTEMQPSGFANEADFQKLLADHPALLRLATGADGDLLLVTQELGIADEEGASGRWSIDHLFLNKDGVPVLVEVKRASDTRARREVVAQMLDYAAHGTAYWSAEEIASRYQATASEYGADPDARLQEFLGEGDPEAFWRLVEANLRAGRIRMVFVADKIGKELRRIVEFLNEQMRPAEVLAIEIAQFTNPSGVRTLVPQLVGATERAQSAKSVTAQLSPISASDWLTSIGTLHGQEVGAVALRVAAFFQGLGLLMRVVLSQKSAAFELSDPSGTARGVFYLIRDPAGLQIGIQTLRNFPAYASEESRFAVLEELKRLGASFRSNTSAGPNSYPTIPLSELVRPDVCEPVLSYLADIVRQAKAA